MISEGQEEGAHTSSQGAASCHLAPGHSRTGLDTERPGVVPWWRRVARSPHQDVACLLLWWWGPSGHGQGRVWGIFLAKRGGGLGGQQGPRYPRSGVRTKVGAGEGERLVV